MKEGVKKIQAVLERSGISAYLPKDIAFVGGMLIGGIGVILCIWDENVLSSFLCYSGSAILITLFVIGAVDYIKSDRS